MTESGSGSDRPAHRFLVVSASMGAGHQSAAAELIRQLTTRGHVAERVDVLALGKPGQGDRLRATYALLLRWLPWLYDAAMRFWRRWPRPLEVLTARGAAAFEAGLLAEIERFRPDAVVSVFNLSSQALGRLRGSGRLAVPVITYVTDPGAHPYWVHPAVDLHLAMLPATAAELERYGASRTVTVRPLVAPVFHPAAADRSAVRARLGLAPDAVVALVSAGSWAAGGVERTVDRLAGTGTVLPLTLCGRDEKLRRRLAARGAGLPVGWTDDVASLMAAADVLVDNAGGLTCWEALACGLPVVLYNPLPGHGTLNALALEQAGWADYARTEQEMVERVSAHSASGSAARTSVAFTGDAADAIVTLTGADRARRAA